MLTPVGKLYNICQINFFFFWWTQKILKANPFGVFLAENFFVLEFDETLYTDAPFDGDHFILKYIFCQVINKHFIPFFKIA
jgi:hypothetical protein